MGDARRFGEEPVRPYDRVPVSKQYLRSKPGRHRLFVEDPDYYDQHDQMLAGVEAARRIELAHADGLAVGVGVLTDAYLATSNPGIFAAGDVARAWHPRLAPNPARALVPRRGPRPAAPSDTAGQVKGIEPVSA